MFNITNHLTGLKGWLAAAALVCTASASADTAVPADLGEIELGKVYDVSAYNMQPAVATFTAPSDGTYYLDGGEFEVYKDAEHTVQFDGIFNANYANGGEYVYEFTGGQTYYLYAWWLSGTKYLKIYTDPPFVLEQANPELGSTITAAGYPQVDFWFSKKISTVSDVKITVGSEVVSNPVWRLVNERIVTVETKEPLNNLYNSGKLKEGDEIVVSFKLSDTDGNLYNGDGDFAGRYVAGRKAATIVSQELPSTFLSYFAPGSEGSVVKLTFDSELSTTRPAQLRLGYGEIEYDGKYYTETILGTVDGCTVTFDLSGKRRIHDEMVTSDTRYETIDLMVGPLYDAQDQYVYSSGQGKMGSMDFQLLFVEIPSSDIYSQFTPAAGSRISTTETVSIWARTMASFSYNGVKITYNDDAGNTHTIVIPQEELSVVADPSDDSAIITFALPAEARNGRHVVVTLNDFVAFDGYDHENDICAVYNDFVITYSIPADGSYLAAINEGDNFCITTNYSELYPELFVMYEIADLNPEDAGNAILTEWAGMTRVDYEGEDYTEFLATMPCTVPLMRSHKYAVNFRAWENEEACRNGGESLGEASIYLYGTSIPYTFSDVCFLSINPENGTELTDPEFRTFTITYDGLVRLTNESAKITLPSGSYLRFESLTPVDPDGGFASVWEMTVLSSYMTSLTDALEFTVRAVDMDGRTVKADFGTDANSYYSFRYPVNYQAGGIEAVFGDSDGAITVYNAAGIKILQTTNPEALKSLTPGFYIVNGKKFILR